MSRYRDNDIACKVYVGDLPRDATDKELERAFNYYGPIKKVWVARNPPGFAFVEFEDPRDADDAVRSLDGTTICGVRARVEHSSGKIRPKPWVGGGRDGGRDGGGRDGGGRDGGRSGGGGGRRGGGRGFDPNDRCYKCGERGHYAYDCRGGGGRPGGSGGRKRSRSRSKSYDRRRSYSRSRSRGRYSHSRSRSPRKRSRDRSISPRRSRSASAGRGRGGSRSRSRSPRGDSPVKNGD